MYIELPPSKRQTVSHSSLSIIKQNNFELCPCLSNKCIQLKDLTVYSDVKLLLNNLTVPIYYIFITENGDFHVNWFAQSTVFCRRAVDYVICSKYYNKNIIHFQTIIYPTLCEETDNQVDYDFALTLYKSLNLPEIYFSDLSYYVHGICAFLELRKTHLAFLTVFKKNNPTSDSYNLIYDTIRTDTQILQTENNEIMMEID